MLRPSLLRTITPTRPAPCAGTRTVSMSAVRVSTVALTPPIATVEFEKPLPRIAIVLPPAIGPDAGSTWVIAGPPLM